MKTITYYYRGCIERGNGKPGYDWHNGYSENNAEGSALYPWNTRRECQAEARAQGATAQFIDPRTGAKL
jgi:hypothetical protein